MIHVAKLMRRIITTGVIPLFLIFIITEPNLYAQEVYDEGQDDEAIEVFWGDEEESSEEEYYDDEYYDDEYAEDEYYEDEYYEDEFYEDEYSDEEYTEDEYYEDEYYEDEFGEGEEGSDVELAEMAERKGLSISVSGSSPGYVSHSLYPYNSGVNFRAAIELPMLMRLGPFIFRIGVEAGNFAFTEWKPPATGELTGISFAGILTFPAGPGQVKVGGGMIGSYPGVVAETTYGFAIRNALEIRAGVRSTTAFGVKDSEKNNLGDVSWLDGLITIGISL